LCRRLYSINWRIGGIVFRRLLRRTYRLCRILNLLCDLAGSADTALPHKSLGCCCDLFFYHRLDGLFFFDVWDIYTSYVRKCRSSEGERHKAAFMVEN
jgi:hypothetical protein